MANTPNFQKPPEGLGSYLAGILPEDVGLAAGAFSWTMQQVKNIRNVDFEKFAQVAASIEVTNARLNLINGTDVPVNKPKAAEAAIILQLGSGPNGTYTASDFFGCMSGLPYSWRELQSTLLAAQTTKLQNIYQELFLAVTWEGAEVSVIVETRQVQIAPGPPPVYQTEYRCAGFTIVNKGGGYHRGTAVNPIITASNGGSGTGIVGTSPSGAQSLGGGTYGRVNSATLTSPGSWVLSPPTATIQYPPTSTLPVQASGAKSTGGSNTAYGTVGWPSPMNAVVQAYINQANAEIVFISQSKRPTVQKLNTIYNYNGTQLEIEQRARYQALDPVPIPRDRWVTHYPTNISAFVDNIGTSYAHSTKPHMYAQTLEAIADLSNVCGQSLVGLMRQERNRERLESLPIPLDNTVPCENDALAPLLISNGTAAAGIKGVGVPVNGINGNPNDPTTTFTSPASLVQKLNSSPPVPLANVAITGTGGTISFDQPNSTVQRGQPVVVNGNLSGTGTIPSYVNPTTFFITDTNGTTTATLSPTKNGSPVPTTAGTTTGLTFTITPESPADSTINPIPAGYFDPNTNRYILTNAVTPLVDSSPVGAILKVQNLNPNTNTNLLGPPGINPIAVVFTGAVTPTGQGTPLDNGRPAFPGSFAGSPISNALPPELNAKYTSAILLPSTYTTAEAIDEVIKCNCDCWVD